MRKLSPIGIFYLKNIYNKILFERRQGRWIIEPMKMILITLLVILFITTYGLHQIVLLHGLQKKLINLYRLLIRRYL